jgi:peroxiredoxin
VAQSRLVRDGLKKGATAPSFTLPALDGTEISLSGFQGKWILLVFSDPECKPCQDLALKLERIHRAANGFTVLMISRGDVDGNKEKATAHRSTFPIVVQRHWEISRAYGIFATPVGYVIDDRGVLASGAAVGGEAILQLAVQRTVPVEGQSSLLEVKS